MYMTRLCHRKRGKGLGIKKYELERKRELTKKGEQKEGKKLEKKVKGK